MKFILKNALQKSRINVSTFNKNTTLAEPGGTMGVGISGLERGHLGREVVAQSPSVCHIRLEH